MASWERIPGTTYRLGGAFGRLVGRVVDRWVLTAPEANPGMLDMFRDRDRLPLRNMVPWAGEFAGKYLTSAVQLLRLTGDERLRSCLEGFVAELLRGQDRSGYLGPWPRSHALTNSAPNTGDQAKPEAKPTWDTWGHYHAMLGLILWWQDTADRGALRAARRIADLLCDRYLGANPRLVETGSTEMNLAPVHALALFHRHTGSRRSLGLAQDIVGQFSACGPEGPLAGNYLAGALDGLQFFELPKPRWESLHPIMGLAELYRITGRADCRTAFEHLWWSIRQTDRHNNGGFSSGEKATGNPYDRGAIESCCTIAWIALGVEMLGLTGLAAVADELELATLNSGAGMHSPGGRWSTYNTPMDGVRRASAHEIVFQSREGTPELNCCSVNAPRGLGMVSDWAVVAGPEGELVLNWYGPSTIVVPLPARPGVTVVLSQETLYPVDGRIALSVRPSARARFVLKLRIPAWSARTTVRLNGAAVSGARAGSYLAIDRDWRRGDALEIALDMSVHLWRGSRECEGLTSIYRGPILLAYDRRFNDMDPHEVPALDLSRPLRKKAWRGSRPPAVLLEAKGTDGRTVLLTDFASAGDGGAPYRSWLPLTPDVLIRTSPFVPGDPPRPSPRPLA